MWNFFMEALDFTIEEIISLSVSSYSLTVEI